MEMSFLSQDVLKWYTRSSRTLESEEVKQIIDAKENHIDVHIFVKKDDDEGSDFYYLVKQLQTKILFNKIKWMMGNQLFI